MGEEVQLDFENQMFIELLAEDGLVVLARGLGLERLFLKFLKLYSDPHQMVLVLNMSPANQSQHVEELLREKVDHLPRSITNEISARERETVYQRGGVVFITSRILVVDMLRGQVPVDRVSGLLVWNAHKVTDSTSEAFILRLYREATKTGFIKAFSDSPEQFTSGFCQLERVMRNLFLRNLYLWPRFHVTVSASLARHKPDVVELRQQLSGAMTVIQMSVLDIMKTCVTELKAANPALEMEEVTVETCMGKSFDVIIRHQLDPVWNQLSSKTRQLVFDLKTLRTVLYFLTQYDCVTFYQYLESLRSDKRGSAFSVRSNWMFLEAANQLFAKARERVFGSRDKNTAMSDTQHVLHLEESPKWHLLSMVLSEIRSEMREGETTTAVGEREGETTTAAGEREVETTTAVGEREGVTTTAAGEREGETTTAAGEREGETTTAMGEREGVTTTAVGEREGVTTTAVGKREGVTTTAVEEREGEGVMGGEGEGVRREVGAGRVLVVVNDERTCYQLKQFLCMGGRGLLEQQFRRFLSHKYPQYRLGGGGAEVGGAKKRKQSAPRKAFPPKKKSREDKDGDDSSQDKDEVSTAILDELAQAELQFDKDGGMSVAPPTSEEKHTHFGLLTEPIVILHALDSSADQPHQLYRVLCDLRPSYVVMYDPDVRSVRQLEVYQASRPSACLRVYFLLYDSSVEEQKYLTALRREKEAFQQLIKDRAHMVLPVDQEGVATDRPDHTHSRRAGGQNVEEKVIVDVREFRSSLPSLLHKRGIKVLPLTLEVGDYVLSPDVCVERKSVSDLIGSLNSGRLYTQATAMTRHYRRPVLLIEFPENKAFSLQSLSSLQSDISSQSSLSKLVLLTLHFPALRILWCSSPHVTAELFLELKSGHAQPDPSQAVSVGQDSLQRSEYNGAAQDFLLKLPGINSKNYRYVLDGVRDLQELVSLSQAQLDELLGNSSNASLLFSFLHSPHSLED